MQNILKRLLSKRLKKKIISPVDFVQGDMTSVKLYKWVYNSPIWQWKKRLWCIYKLSRDASVDEVESLYRLFYQHGEDDI